MCAVLRLPGNHSRVLSSPNHGIADVLCLSLTGRVNIASQSTDPVQFRWEGSRTNGFAIQAYELSYYTPTSTAAILRAVLRPHGVSQSYVSDAAPETGAPPGQSEGTGAGEAGATPGNTTSTGSESLSTASGGTDENEVTWIVDAVVPGRMKRHRTTMYEASVAERGGPNVTKRIYRVRARSVIGWSDYSEPSVLFVLKTDGL